MVRKTSPFKTKPNVERIRECKKPVPCPPINVDPDGWFVFVCAKHSVRNPDWWNTCVQEAKKSETFLFFQKCTSPLENGCVDVVGFENRLMEKYHSLLPCFWAHGPNEQHPSFDRNIYELNRNTFIPKLQTLPNPASDDLVFQVTNIDVDPNGKPGKPMMIGLFGVNHVGHHFFVEVTGFQRQVYLQMEDNWSVDQVKALEQFLLRHDRIGSSITKFKQVRRERLVGYNKHRQIRWLEVSFHNQFAATECQNYFRENRVCLPNFAAPISIPCEEGYIRPDLDFVERLKINPNRWIRIKKGQYMFHGSFARSRSEYDATCPVEAIEMVPEEQIPAYNGHGIGVAIDIETYSHRKGQHADARLKPDVIQQITHNCFWTDRIVQEQEVVVDPVTKKETKRRKPILPFRSIVLTLGSCDPVEGVEIYSFRTEAELLKAHSYLLREVLRPIYHYTYNGYKYDYPYLKARAIMHGLWNDYMDVGRVLKVEKFRFFEGADGEMYPVIRGCTTIDVCKVVRKDVTKRFPSYKLDVVATVLLGRGKSPFSYESVYRAFETTSKERADEATYCARDGEATGQLFIQGQYQIAASEQCSIQHVTFHYVVNAGTGIKTFSEIMWMAHNRGMVVNGIQKPSNNNNDRETHHGLHSITSRVQKQATLSYTRVDSNGNRSHESAQNPASGIPFHGRGQEESESHAEHSQDMDDDNDDDNDDEEDDANDTENEEVDDCDLDITLASMVQDRKHALQVKHDRVIPKEDNEEENRREAEQLAQEMGIPVQMVVPQGQLKVSKTCAASPKRGSGRAMRRKAKYGGGWVAKPRRRFYILPIVTLDFRSEYPSVIVAHNLCYSTLILDDAMLKDTPHIQVDLGDGTFARFAIDVDGEGKTIQGVLATICSKLLDERDRVKAMMKKEKDPAAYAQLDARQNALKISANALYGATGADTFMIPCMAIAASVTALGRFSTMTARNLILDKYDGSIAVYGDTDSVMILFGCPTLEEAMRLGSEGAKYVTEQLNKLCQVPFMLLQFEKVYWPYALWDQKNYCGVKYEPGKEPVFEAKGVQSVRRDNADVVTEPCDELIRILCDHRFNKDWTMRQRQEAAVTMLQTHLLKMVRDEIPVEKYVITSDLKEIASYANPLGKVHVNLAIRIANRDPGNAPQARDRVPYVIHKGDGPYAHRGEEPERFKDPQYGLKVDVEYYMDKRLFPAVQKLLFLWKEIDVVALFAEARRRMLVGTKQKSIRDMLGTFASGSTSNQKRSRDGMTDGEMETMNEGSDAKRRRILESQPCTGDASSSSSPHRKRPVENSASNEPARKRQCVGNVIVQEGCVAARTEAYVNDRIAKRNKQEVRKAAEKLSQVQKNAKLQDFFKPRTNVETNDVSRKLQVLNPNA